MIKIYFCLLVFLPISILSRQVVKVIRDKNHDRTSSSTYGSWKTWVYCPENYFVYAYSARKTCSSAGFEFINLYCMDQNGNKDSTPINSYDENNEYDNVYNTNLYDEFYSTAYSTEYDCPNNGLVTGFTFESDSFYYLIIPNHLALYNLKLACQNSYTGANTNLPYYNPNYITIDPECSHGYFQSEYNYCDAGTAVCGIVVKYHNYISLDWQGITDLEMACCYIQCKPNSRMYFNTGTNKCDYCHYSCLSCSGPGANECLTCHSTFTKSGGTCTPPLEYLEMVNVFHMSDLSNISSELQSGLYTQTAWTASSSITGLKSQCGNYYILGGYNKCGACGFQKQISNIIPHYKLRVMARLFKLDSWDNEFAMLKIDGVSQSIPELLFSWSDDFFYYGNLCGDQKYPESIYFLDYTMTHLSTTLILIITSNLNGGSSDESFGIRDVTISIYICHYTCSTCNGPLINNCLSCYTGMTIDSSNMCKCNSANYYLVTLANCNIAPCSSCSLCHSSCSTCNGASSSNCLTCATSYFQNSFTGDSCLASCLPPYWGDTSTTPRKCVETCPLLNSFGDIASSRFCMTCDFTCKTCVDNKFKCTSCDSPKFLTSTSTCVNTCGSPYYGVTSTLKCELNCPNNEYMHDIDRKCYSSCPSPYKGNPLIKKCVNPCPDGMFSTAGNICELCDVNCATCVTTKDNCVICRNSWSVNSGNCIIPANTLMIQTKIFTTIFTDAVLTANNWEVHNADTTNNFQTICDTYNLLGGYQKFSQNTYIQRDFTNIAPHYKVRITFGFMKIGNWNPNKLLVYIDNAKKYEQIFTSLQDTTITKYCGDSNYNEAFRYIEVYELHEGDTLSIKITTDLSVSSSIASWGINNLQITIDRCHESCKKCSSELVCTDCYTNAIINPTTNKCDCINNYYQTNQASHTCTTSICSTCTLCDITCYTCNGATDTNCLSCQLNRYFHVNKCDTSCPNPTVGINTAICTTNCLSTKTYLDSNRICQNCHSTCLTCTGALETECSTCDIGLFLNYYPPNTDKKCLGDCIEGWMTDINDYKCKKCDSNCKTCVDLITKCTSCETGKFLNGNVCENKCTAPYWGFISTKKCELNCLDNEFQNDDDRICYQVCETSYHGNPLNRKCELNCPIGMYFDSNNLCKYCDFDCYTCSGSSSNCLICKYSWNVLSGVCQKPQNILNIPITISDLIIENSLNPSIKETICGPHSIIGGLGLLGSSAIIHNTYNTPTPHYSARLTYHFLKIDKWDSNLFKTLIDNTIIDTETFVLTSGTTITKYCGASFFNEVYLSKDLSFDHSSSTLKVLFTSDLTLPADQSSWGISDLSLSIYRCHETCQQCTGSLSTQCSHCYLHAQLSSNNECICDTHYYMDALPQFSCISQTCSNCLECHISCNKCSGPLETDCLDCNLPNYFDFDTKKCAISCPNPKKGITSTKTCENSCLTDQEYIDSNRICQACHISCKTCSGPLNTNCLSCNNGKFLNFPPGPSYECLSNCINGWFEDNFNNECKICNNNCKTCINLANECTSCDPDYLNTLTKTCENHCDSPYYAVLSTHKCQLNCLNNEYEHDLDRKCYSICPNTYYGNPMTKKCVSTCPDGMFPIDNICKFCDFDCQTCSSSKNYCDICKYSWNINLGNCERSQNILKLENYFNSGFSQTDFDNSGWNIENSYSSPYLSDCGDFHILGGYNKFGSNTKLFKTITNIPPHYKLRITFYLLKIDNWLSKNFFIKLNNIIIATIQFQSTTDNEITQYCGDVNYNEAYRSIDLYLDNKDPSLIFEFYTDLDLSADQSSWGISELSIYIDRCHETCKECSGPSQTECTVCYLYAHKTVNNECVCNDHYYMVKKLQFTCIVPDCSSCNICHSTCNKCTAETDHDCINCIDPYYFYETDKKCLTYCPSPKKGVTSIRKCEDSCTTIHEFIDSSRICQNCQATCNTCSGASNNECLSCYTDKYLNYPPGPAYECLTNCISGWNPDPSDNKCKQCDSNCKTCIDTLTKCTSCDSLFLDTLINKCVSRCPDTYYGVKSLKKCELNCLKNEFEHDVDRICYVRCPDPYHGNPLTKKCELNCPDLMFSPVSNNICEYCDFDCNSCSNTNSNCDSCKNSWNLNSGSCTKPPNIKKIDSYFIGLFDHNYIINSGWTIQNAFSPSNYVTDCNNYHIIGGINNFGKDTILSKTITNTLPHYKVRITFNLLKIDNWNNNKFITKIDSFTNTQTFSPVSDSLITELCGSENYNEAYRAIDLYTSHNDIDLHLVFTSDLNTNADISSWGISNLNIYLDRCYENCKKCTGLLSTNCEECFVNSHLTSENKCECDDTFYQIITNYDTCTSDQCSSCLVCHPTCHHCSGGDETECLSCISPYFFYQNKCLTSCPLAKFGIKSTSKCENSCTTQNEYIDINRICQDCDISCNKCTGPLPNDCLNCKPLTYLFEKQCLADCPSGLTKNQIDLTCDNCNINCKSCSGPTMFNCKSCFDSNFLFIASESDSQCLKICPIGYYPDSIDNKCKKCKDECSECEKIDKCKKCKNQVFFYNNDCFLKCPENMFGEPTKSICVGNCLNGFYRNNETRICVKCINGCKECFSDIICKNCESNLVFQNGKCRDKCENNFFPNLDNICVNNCGDNCVKCIDYKTCDKCDNSTYVNNKGICVKCNNINEIIIENERKCINCPENCNKCLNINKCEECNLNYALNINLQCVKIIKVNGYLKNTLNSENIILEFSENAEFIFKNKELIIEELKIENIPNEKYIYRVEISKTNNKIYNIFFSFKTGIKSKALLTIKLFQNNLIGNIYVLQNTYFTLNLLEYNHCDTGYKYFTDINKCIKLISITPELSLTTFSTTLLLKFSENFGEIFQRSLNNTEITIENYNKTYYSYQIIPKPPSVDDFEISLAFSGPITNHPLLTLILKIDPILSYNNSYPYFLTSEQLSINLKNYDGTSKQLLETTAKSTETMNSIAGPETMTATNIVSSGASFAIRAMMCMDLIRMLRFLQINYPEIVIAIFQTDIKITNIVPDFNYKEDELDKNLPFIFEQFGMSIYLINNIGCMILENFIYVGLGLFTLLINKMIVKFKITNKIIDFIFKVLSSVLIWNFPLSYFMSSYLEYMFSSLLALRYYSLKTNFAIFNFLLSLTVFVSMIISIYLIFRKIRGIRKLKKEQKINKIMPYNTISQNSTKKIPKFNEKFEKMEVSGLGNEILKTDLMSPSIVKKIEQNNKKIENIPNKDNSELNLKDESILSPIPMNRNMSTPFKISKEKMFSENIGESVVVLNETKNKNNHHEKNNNDFMILFNDFHQVSKWQGYYLIIDLIRQSFFSMIFVCFYDLPIAGLCFLFIINIFMFYLILFKNPFNNKGDTIQTFVNEFFLNISYISALILAVCDFNNKCDVNTRNNVGWVILGCNFFLVGFFLIRFCILCMSLMITIVKFLWNLIKNVFKKTNKILPEEKNIGTNEKIPIKKMNGEMENKMIDVQNVFLNA